MDVPPGLDPRKVAQLPSLTPTLGAHLATANYLFAPQPRGASTSTGVFATVDDAWHSVLDKRVVSEMDVVLENVFLLDWFPRAPGLFYSSRGREARQSGEQHRATLPDGTAVYTPLGKQDMLQGGIGSVRLKPITIEGERLYLMSATSTGIGHEAFPIAMPRGLYRRVLDEITARGAAPATVVGTLEYVPNRFDSLYLTDVPRIYLRVEEVLPPSSNSSRNTTGISIAVAVTVSRSDHDTYASFVNFDPGRSVSFESAIDWMRSKYVPYYGGKIITDFDERESHFGGEVPFSLANLMSLDIDKAAATIYVNELHLGYGVEAFLQRVQTLEVKHVSVDKSVTVTGGNVGAIGVDSSNVTGTVQQASALLNGPQARELVQRIEAAFVGVQQGLDTKKADRIARDIDQLKEEASAENPSREWYSVSLNGIKEAAAAVGAVGLPLLKVASELSKLVGLS